MQSCSQRPTQQSFQSRLLCASLALSEEVYVFQRCCYYCSHTGNREIMMADDEANLDSATKASGTKRVTVRSAVGNPYFNLVDSLEVARLIHEKAGGTCTPVQLVGLLGYTSMKSGTFQMRFSSARQFGFVRVDNGTVAVTERSYKILSPVMPEDCVTAKAEAFLSVELFKLVYDLYLGGPLPPEDGLRNLLLQKFGFSAERAVGAVKVLLSSAEQAGFFSVAGKTKLIYPTVAKTSPASEVKSAQAKPDSDEQQLPEKVKHILVPDAPATVHSAIIGLLRDLPAPGTVWPAKQKKRFIKAFQATLDFVYESDDDDHEGNG
jgi:hypothetical protein